MINHLREKGYAIEYSQKNQNYLLKSRDGHPLSVIHCYLAVQHITVQARYFC